MTGGGRAAALLLFALSGGAARADEGAARAANGAALYRTNCSICHQAAGAGQPGLYPRLAGRVGPISRTSKGRTFLISVLLFGMIGKVPVDGVIVSGVMPGFAWLGDEKLAAILNYLAATPPQHGIRPYRPADFAARRPAALAPAAVAKLAVDRPE